MNYPTQVANDSGEYGFFKEMNTSEEPPRISIELQPRPAKNLFTVLAALFGLAGMATALYLLRKRKQLWLALAATVAAVASGAVPWEFGLSINDLAASGLAGPFVPLLRVLVFVSPVISVLALPLLAWSIQALIQASRTVKAA